ncbi:MAG: D-alanyl-D-alanine carboxypeptidase/D-alanyl-D-alanine-endopeptidase [Odoribacter sp.]
MVRRIVTCILCLLAVVAVGQDKVALERFLQTEGLTNAAIGISLKRVTDGKVKIEYCADMALTPASVTKLIPTWLALKEKGIDYCYSTTVFYTGTIRGGILSGDILIQAAGDPCLESRYFPNHLFMDTLVKAIVKAGIREIKGKIIVEGGKVGMDIPGSWTWEDVSNYYAALYLPFNYRDNTYTLTFRSGEAGQTAQIISVKPPLPGIRIISEVIASGQRDNAWIFGGPYSSVLCVKGSIPPNQSSFKIKGAMHNPAAAFSNELMIALKGKGISVENTVGEKKTLTKLFVIHSPCLEEIVYRTNKFSVNLFAEALGKLVGGEQWTRDVPELLNRAGVANSGITLRDACGLSPMDAVPADVFTNLLICAARETGESFVRSLPVAGVDAGLNGYCVAASTLKYRLKAKTGSMAGVRCLAGYLTALSGEQFAFTLLINHYTCSTAQLQQAVGKFLQAML